MHSAMHFMAEHSPRRTARAHELISGPVATQFVITAPAFASPPPGVTPAAVSISVMHGPVP